MNPIALFAALFFCTGICVAAEPVALGAQRELLVDEHLIARMEGVTLKIHQPQAQEVALVCDAPWEGNTSGYFTFFQDGDLFRGCFTGGYTDERGWKPLSAVAGKPVRLRFALRDADLYALQFVP